MHDWVDSVDGIAVIGMSGRFPGADNVEQFWNNLLQKVESITELTDEELLASRIDPAIIANPRYIKAKGILGNTDQFDAAFFGYNPRVAELTDPQHRIFLECSWEAIEDAGYNPDTYEGRIGVFAGQSMNTYWLHNLYEHVDLIASVESLQAAIGNDKDSLTTEVSYKLNLKGPAVTIQSSSSTSLTAIHYACQSLLSYECDMALSGGISIHFPEKAGYLYHEGGTTSPDGHCRAFDEKAQGFVSGHGAGCVVLKRLSDALRDGDHVYAVIKGSAVNNDGTNKVSYMAPSVKGQAEVIAMAQAMAGVEPESITYIEAHGTGTRIGDPIEVEALTEVFRRSTDKKGYCALGSVKTNIGHLDTAAGVIGLIKASLAVKHGIIPPTLHFEKPNPQMDLENSPFYVPTEVTKWVTGDQRRRAGVSSFGMGGTNAHVILENVPEPEEAQSSISRPYQLLTFSAKTATALKKLTDNLANHLKDREQLPFADVAYTLNIGRKTLSHRRFIVASDTDEGIQALQEGSYRAGESSVEEERERPVVFLFTGQGSQYVNMGKGLYETEAVFKMYVDQCCELLLPVLNLDLRDVLYPPADREAESAEMLRQTWLTQPALFVIEYALAKLWMAWGIQPQAMIGHSVGEYVAACLSGVFTLEDALHIIAMRGRMIQELPAGSMLSVQLSPEELEPLLDARLSLAAWNGNRLCVVSGETEHVMQFQQLLEQQGVTSTLLQTSHAFHSHMMEPIVQRFTACMQQISLRSPRIPYLSNVTGTWITEQEATDPGYWAKHLRQGVMFAPGIQTLLEEPSYLFLEVGPGSTLHSLVKELRQAHQRQVVLHSLRHPKDSVPDARFLMQVVGKLWLAGAVVNWEAFYQEEPRRRVPLPTYPFERQRYWIEPLDKIKLHGSGGNNRRQRPEEWLYHPIWKQSAVRSPREQIPVTQTWLVLVGEDPWSRLLVHRLMEQNQTVISVRKGHAYQVLDENVFVIRPNREEDYAACLQEVAARGLRPDHLLHVWLLEEKEFQDKEPYSVFETYVESGFDSLLSLARTWETCNGTNAVRLTLLSDRLHDVMGYEQIIPEKTVALAAGKVIAQEFPQIQVSAVDLDLRHDSTVSVDNLADFVIEQCRSKHREGVVAYRGNRRFVPAYENMEIETSTPLSLPQLETCLITGGLGDLGLLIAEVLVKQGVHKLALLGRTPVPKRAEWEQWLRLRPDDPITEKIRRVQSLEQMGARVMVLEADVSSLDQMRQATDEIIEQWGRLDGIFHAAGAVHERYFQFIRETTADVSSQHFVAKVQGLYVLDTLVTQLRPTCCILISSLASLLGGMKSAHYAAANQFMDSFSVCSNRAGKTMWASWNLDAFLFGAEKEQVNLIEQSSFSENAMRPYEFALILPALLARIDMGRVAVSTIDLNQRSQEWVSTGAFAPEQAIELAHQAALHPRPSLQNPYVAPRNEIEKKICDIWQRTLGIDQVGIQDNFFELGGNSLVGIKLIAQINEAFSTTLLPVRLYEGPTVQTFAELLGDNQMEKPALATSKNRGELRREKRKQLTKS